MWVRLPLTLCVRRPYVGGTSPRIPYVRRPVCCMWTSPYIPYVRRLVCCIMNKKILPTVHQLLCLSVKLHYLFVELTTIVILIKTCPLFLVASNPNQKIPYPHPCTSPYAGGFRWVHLNPPLKLMIFIVCMLLKCLYIHIFLHLYTSTKRLKLI